MFLFVVVVVLLRVHILFKINRKLTVKLTTLNQE